MTTTQFADLGIDQDLVDALSERGITTPLDIQTLTIPDGLAGRGVATPPPRPILRQFTYRSQ